MKIWKQSCISELFFSSHQAISFLEIMQFFFYYANDFCMQLVLFWLIEISSKQVELLEDKYEKRWGAEVVKRAALAFLLILLGPVA